MLDQRTVPNYTIAEASRCLGIPAATLRSWFKGHNKDGRHYTPFLDMSDPGRLTFFEMMQADALFHISNGNQTNLRGFRPQLRRIDPMELVQRDHLFVDRHSIYRQFKDKLESLREGGQLYNKDIIAPYLKRVRYDRDDLVYRIYPFLSRPATSDEGLPKLNNIVIDPKVCYGAVFHEKIGAPVAIVGKRFDLGDDEELLAKDYCTTRENIREALRARNLIYVHQEAA